MSFKLFKFRRVPTNGITKRNLSTLPEKARIVEVGPRDGLQNEKTTVPTEVIQISRFI